MRFTSYADRNGRESFGIVTGKAEKPEGIIDLGDRYPTLRDLLADEKGLDFARSRVSAAPSVKFGEVKLLPVIPNPDKILCVGINFASHVRETGRPMPTKPWIFSRFAVSQVGAEDAMLCPRVSDKFDYEGELAVIIGKRTRYVSPEKALERVAGYSCYNDGTLRDWQNHSGQFVPGKNFPRTGAFGPWMVTADEMPDLPSVTIKTRLNGNEMQSARLDDLIFDVPALINYCSSMTELEVGDVIICGTTGGVGAFRDPQVWMKAGDKVEVEVSGVGTLRNTVVKEPADFAI